MDLPSKKVFALLEEKGVKELHHANSVLTSCQFLRRARLLSRGTVERQKLFQTEQSSDDLDKQFGIWFDVFADTVDIHHRARRRNLYGPVLIVLNVEKLRESYTGRIWITKKNPVYWKDLPDDQRWFRSLDELKSDFQAGAFAQMAVFRHCGGELPIKKAITKLVLDDPSIRTKKGDVDYFSMAYGALRLSLFEGGMDVSIEKRSCPPECKCQKEYRSDLDMARQFFVPRL